MSLPEDVPRRRHVLMIAPYFYPCQIIGAHRGGKFCKYLPRLGYDVSVVCINARAAGWPTDDRLLGQIPGSVRRVEAFYPFTQAAKTRIARLARQLRKLVRTGSSGAQASPNSQGDGFESAQSWLDIPDKDIFWTPWALAASLRLARQADVIYATSPPPSILVIGGLLKRLTGRPLVLDLRDPWTISHLRHYPTRVHRWLDATLERWTFALADSIICNTDQVADRYRQHYPELPASRITVIPNGYDEEDFVGLVPASRLPSKVRIGYFGMIYAGRTPASLFWAARRCLDEGVISRDRIEFVFFGPSGDVVLREAEEAGISDIVAASPTVPYAEALTQMAACDVLLIISSPETDALHVPGKTFEYLALHKPILALAGPGSLGDLMERYRFGVRVAFEDEDGLYSALKQLYGDILAGDSNRYVAPGCEEFSRRRLTGRLASVFDAVCAKVGSNAQ